MDVVEGIQERVQTRIAELEPLIEEYHRLQAVQEALAGAAAGSGAAPTSSPRARAGARRTGRAASGGAGRSRRSTRADQALALIGEHPGITVPDLAKKMGIDPNYLYRVVPNLEKASKVRREDNGWHLVAI